MVPVVHDVVAVALISGLAGVSGSGATYFATKRQADRQADTERERIQSELDCLRLEQEEPHLQHRQVVYHQYLDIIGRWHTHETTDVTMTSEEFNKWGDDAEHCFNAVALFGTRDAYDAAEALRRAVEAGVFAEKFVGSPEAKAYDDAYFATIDAMRKDTAPADLHE